MKMQIAFTDLNEEGSGSLTGFFTVTPEYEGEEIRLHIYKLLRSLTKKQRQRLAERAELSAKYGDEKSE